MIDAEKQHKVLFTKRELEIIYLHLCLHINCSNEIEKEANALMFRLEKLLKVLDGA